MSHINRNFVIMFWLCFMNVPAAAVVVVEEVG